MSLLDQFRCPDHGGREPLKSELRPAPVETRPPASSNPRVMEDRLPNRGGEDDAA